MKKAILYILVVLTLTSCSSLEINDGKISKYFTAREALTSYTAQKYGIRNNAKGKDRENVYYAARRMDRVREALGEPIYVTSWYRNPKVNRKVGGSKKSAHMDGLAIDFRVKSNPKYVYSKLKKKGISYDQLIYYPRERRLHIGFKKNRRLERNQYFIK